MSETTLIYCILEGKGFYNAIQMKNIEKFLFLICKMLFSSATNWTNHLCMYMYVFFHDRNRADINDSS